MSEFPSNRFDLDLPLPNAHTSSSTAVPHPFYSGAPFLSYDGLRPYTMSEPESNAFILNGWVLSSDPGSIFPVLTLTDERIGMLKERILPKIGIGHILAKDLELWKVSYHE